MTRWKIKIWDQHGRRYADDFADSETDARQQASGWTGQRGQMRWTAVVYRPDGTKAATYKRGQEVKP